MAGRLLRMKDIERDYHRVVNLSEKNIELSELMDSAYSNRSEALNDVLDRWNDYDEAKSNLSKAEKQFQKGEIDDNEYQRFVDKLDYRKRRSKRASKRYKEAKNEIRELRREREENKRLLSSRIFSEDDWNST
ncbi:MAG: hypothetical protein HXK95_001895 [Candidatus Nanogingivalaceae bacterium]|jgi:hypothetical protein|nr:MAG: hypothetical protein HXK94_001890 [Candidatus Nanogingivalaceae bacterium]QWB91316.1 MAG: hypothetical protein HXK95_001895 [Candidatus Nanogingivalaceae bacterium]